MGLDINFVSKVKCAPRPGWEFGGYLLDASYDDFGYTASLDDIAAGYVRWVSDREPDEADQAPAAEFVAWCVDFWREKGYGRDDAVSMLPWS